MLQQATIRVCFVWLNPSITNGLLLCSISFFANQYYYDMLNMFFFLLSHAVLYSNTRSNPHISASSHHIVIHIHGMLHISLGISSFLTASRLLPYPRPLSAVDWVATIPLMPIVLPPYGDYSPFFSVVLPQSSAGTVSHTIIFLPGAYRGI